jgi:TolB-like protein
LAVAQPTTLPSAPLAKVLIVPFKQMGDLSSHAWVGAAIQENLISDTAANPTVQAIAANQPLANMDSPDAVKVAQGAGASIVVFGSYQLSADQLRVTGQALDVGSGRVLATLQVTGAVTDLFKIEDTLGSQLDAALPQPPSNLAQVTYGPNTAAVAPDASSAPAPAPVDAANGAAPAGQAYPDASQTYAYPSTTYVYPPTYYYNSYPYYYPYPSFYFYGGFRPYYYGGHGFIWHGGGWHGGGGSWHGGGGGHFGGVGGGHR